MCQLDWISGLSVREFLEEISIWMGRLSKVDCPPQCGQSSCDSLWAWIEPKGGGRENLLFLPDYWRCISIFCPQCPCLRPSIFDWKLHPLLSGSRAFELTPLAFLGLQLIEGKSWDFSASITMRVKTLQSISLNQYIILFLFLWQTLTNILQKG